MSLSEIYSDITCGVIVWLASWPNISLYIPIWNKASYQYILVGKLDWNT